MKRLALALAACLAAGPLLAQSFGVTDGDGSPVPDLSEQAQEIIDGTITVETLSLGDVQEETIGLRGSQSAPVIEVSPGAGAILRGLDKVSGAVTDFDLRIGDEAKFGRLAVELGECRYPSENPSGDAFAYLTVRAEGLDEPAFEGWMIASSPALSALDHPRYDVWVIRCRTS